MTNLTVNIINPPLEAAYHWIHVHEARVDYMRGSIPKVVSPIDQSSAHELPEDWQFPAGFRIFLHDHEFKQVYSATNLYVDAETPGFVDVDQPATFGEYTWDCALDRFVDEPKRPDPKRPVGLWPWLVGGLVVIGLVVAHKKRGR